MARDNIILPHKIYKSMRRFSDAECGRLFRALLLYSMREEQSIKLQGREEALFDVYAQEIDDDIAAYERKCEQNRANASGGIRQQATASERQRRQTNASDGMRQGHNNNNNCNNQDSVPESEKKEQDNDAAATAIGADGRWRRSERARRATAQRVVDAIVAGRWPARVCENLFDVVEEYMRLGADPAAIVDVARDADVSAFSARMQALVKEGDAHDDI